MSVVPFRAGHLIMLLGAGRIEIVAQRDCMPSVEWRRSGRSGPLLHETRVRCSRL